jgi:hypothetical protein
MDSIKDTDYFHCNQVGERVRVCLERKLAPANPGCLPNIATRVTGCTGAVTCGWRYLETTARNACPYLIGIDQLAA